MKHYIKKTMATALAATASIALLAGCSGSAGAEQPGDGDGLVPVNVGVFAAADNAALYMGVEQGFFEEQGLDVDIQVLDSGPAVTAAVVAGDIDFGYSNTLSLVIASSRGLPITVVSGGVAAGQDVQGGSDANAAVLVPSDSDIVGLESLPGKTIAVNALGNILEVTLKNALETEGIDTESVNMVEIPFPEMPAALASGQVDAAFMLEPFVTMSEMQDDARPVAFPYELVTPGFQADVYFTTMPFLQGNEATVTGFQNGLKAAVEYSKENPDAARAVVPTFLSIPEDMVAEMNLPTFITEADPEHIELFVELGQRYDLVEGEVDLETLTAGLSR